MATDVQITSKREHIRRSGPIRSFREPIATDPRGRYPSGVAPPASNLRVLAALRKAGSSRSLISATRSRFSRTRTCFRRSSWFNARKKARRLGAFAFALYHGNSFELKTSVSRLAARVLNIQRSRLGSEAWSLEPKAAFELLEKIERSGAPLSEYAGVDPRAGFSTGLNEAFVIDAKTRTRLISEDARSGEIIKPYLRGQDIDRWVSNWAGLWLIFARRGIDIDAYPAVRAHLEQFGERLEPRALNWKGGSWPGRKPGPYKWFEIHDSVNYWELFGVPKIIYPDLTWRPCFSLDVAGSFGSKTLYFLPKSDTWLLAVLNAPISWWFAWRTTLHGKDEVMESVPVPTPFRRPARGCRRPHSPADPVHGADPEHHVRNPGLAAVGAWGVRTDE